MLKKLRCSKKNKVEDILTTVFKRNWIGHILKRNCLLKIIK